MYNSNEFKTAWQEWKNHKYEKHGSPYTPSSEERALSSLFKKSHGIEDLAIQSIGWSIERNWADIYIKSNYNGKSSANGGDTATGGKQGGTSSDRVEALRNW